MKFSYRAYLSEVPGSSDVQLIVRPVISVRVVGKAEQARCDALVDTGADETLLPWSLARLLQVDFEEHTSQAAGISGEPLTIHYAPVELSIAAEGETITWKTLVGFVEFGGTEQEIAVLGHGGCLDYFTATFDGENAELELTPNSLLPAL